MSELVVLAFDSESGAQQMLGDIDRLQKEQLIKLDDAAWVVRKPDGKASVKQANSLVGAGAFGGAFWGMLIGLLFFAPWLGLAIGAISGALAGKFSDIGIDDNFIKSVSESIQPGYSALFLMIREVTTDKVLEDLKGTPGIKVIHTSLSHEAEQRLRDALATPQSEHQPVA
jgi:uncharacterized membrane protein